MGGIRSFGARVFSNKKRVETDFRNIFLLSEHLRKGILLFFIPLRAIFVCFATTRRDFDFIEELFNVLFRHRISIPFIQVGVVRI